VSVTDVRVGSSTWTRDVGVAVSGSSLRKTGAAGWTSGAVSANTLEAGDGAMEFTATETNTTRVAGLSDGDLNQSWQDITYGIELHDDATVEVVEAGTSRGTVGSYAAGDRFRVDVVSGVVTYARNGSVFYISALAPSYPMVVDTALYSVGATLTDVVLIPLVWTDLSGVSVSENSLTKTTADGWNAGAATTFGLLSDNGYLEFKAVETNTRRTVGFKSGTGTAQTYADLAYAIDLGATGIVTLFEDGISRGTFGSYAHGDRFRIEISEGVVRYLRNGAVLYTSTGTPTYPLRGDVRLYTAGATVADVLGGTEVWMPPVNVTAMGSSLVKTGSVTVAWDAEALSTRGFGTGFIEFTAAQTNMWRHVGLTNGDNGTDYSDLDFAIHLNQLGQIHVFEGATYVGYFGTYITGDRFRVQVVNGIVSYLRNGSVFYTSTRTPTLPLRPDVNIYNPGVSVLNIHIGGEFMVETPTISPGSGTYSATQTVSISTTTANATIRYTTDGSAPTEASTVYAGPFSIATSTTIKAAAFRSGWTPSTTASATYTMNFGTLPLPGITPAAGTYTSEAAVTLSSIAGATIRYTLNGADPTTASALYTGPFSVVTTATLKVKAWHPDYAASAVASAAYTIVVAAPTLTPGTGSYTAGQLITVATATSGATITYTLNGADPVQTDPVVPVSGKLTAGNFTLKTKAWRTGATASAVTTAVYTVIGDLVPPTVAGAVFAGFGLRRDGTVWGWGRNDQSSVGDGTSTPRFNPVPIAGLTGVRTIGAGYYRNLALLSDGSVAGWGLNSSGEIGDGTTTTRATPTAVVGLTDAIALASGTSHAVAIRANGTVVSWGYNATGQLGDGTTTNRTAPVAVPGLTDITAIAAGTDQTLALRADGTVWSWGDNAQGQLGDGTTTRRLTPVQVSGLTNVVSVHAGNGASMAIKADGSVWTWGWNFYGQLGDGTNVNRLTPVQMSGISDAITGGIGWEYSLVLRNDGTVWSSGRNSEGQLGIAGGDRLTPTQIPGLPTIARLDVGAVTAFAITSDGAAWAWGRNTYENIGDGTATSRPFPVQIAGPGLVWRPWIPGIGIASGQYSVEQYPIISNADPSAVMHYSLTGVDPTESDPVVNAGASVAITQSVTLKVRSFKTGAPPSEMVSATYTLKVVGPVFSPAGGSYPTPQSVGVSTSTSGVTIRYTDDGRTPDTYSSVYTAPVGIAVSTVLRAFASRTGWTSSDVVSANYWIAAPATLVAPTISPAAGTYTSGRVVTITPAEAGATVRYTIDGTEPT
jgi:alpha-tubulin suppressor-like RCC1 family protein